MNKARRMVKIWNASISDPKWRWNEERLAYHSYKNRQMCSCSMCGHQRYWEGPTIQEKRQTAWMEPLYYNQPNISEIYAENYEPIWMDQSQDLIPFDVG